MKDFDTAMMVTHRAGELHVRPMAVAELEADASAYFVTSLDSPKVAEIESEPKVTLTFQDSRQYAAVHGTVSVERDQATIDRLWKKAWQVWFPKGKEDPSLTLLKFDATQAEYWDNSGLQGVKYAMSAISALAKGETPRTDQTQNAKVAL